MKILLAFDSFKQSMSSLEAAKAFSKGFLKAGGRDSFETLLISDGGEGFMDSLIYGRGKRVFRQVTGPLGDKVRAPFGYISSKHPLAVVEMATSMFFTEGASPPRFPWLPVPWIWKQQSPKVKRGCNWRGRGRRG